MPEDRARAQYQADRGREYHQAKRQIPDAATPWVARLRAEKIALHVTADQVVFEVGAGFGWNLAALTCRRRLASDAAEFLAPTLQAQGIEFVADPAALPARSVDVVLCHHVLEHVLRPPELLGELERVLQPGGKLLVFVPFERERQYRRFDPAEPNHHLYSWNAQTLGNLVTTAGFQVQSVGVGRFGYDRFAAVWAVRLRLGETGFRCLRSLVHALRPGCEVRLVAVKSR